MDKPVAYMDEQGHLFNTVTHPENYTPLYIRRDWVGLTTAETKALWSAAEKKPSQFAAMLEAKLKEKNDG